MRTLGGSWSALCNGGTAFVTVTSSNDAKKAVQTFDHGELNGQTITVTLV